MIKVKILKNEATNFAPPIKDLDEPIDPRSKVSGHGLSTDNPSVRPAGGQNVNMPRYAMEESCGCDCDSCMSGDHHEEDDDYAAPRGPEDSDDDGVISACDLASRFDLDRDGEVTPEEFEDAIKWYCEHPEYLENLFGDDDEEEHEEGCGCEHEDDEEYEIEPEDAFMLYEKKDRCYYQAKRKYNVFPSAYASGYIVRCRKGKVGRKKSKKKVNESLEEKKYKPNFSKEKEQGLHGWFSRNRGKGWVNCRTGGPCGRKKAGKGARGKYPACRPTKAQCNKTGVRRKKGKTRVSWKPKSQKE